MTDLPSPENRDDLFRKSVYPKSGFVFDEKVTEVFDDMLQRSIPHYREVAGITCDFLLKGPGGIVYDLGSSTGNFLLGLAARDRDRKFKEYRGIDNSPAMIKKAEMKFKEHSSSLPPGVKMNFICADLLTYDYDTSGSFTLHYTLQFISPERRGELLKKLHTVLVPGGLLVLSEKVDEEGGLLREFFINRYHRFKAANRYTSEEIARKKEALEQVLIPFTAERYGKLLGEIGFREISIAFKWYNFITWFAVK